MGKGQKVCHRPLLRRADAGVIPTQEPPLDRPLGTSRGLVQRVSRQRLGVQVGLNMKRGIFIAWTTVRVVHKSRRFSCYCGLKNGWILLANSGASKIAPCVWLRA